MIPLRITYNTLDTTRSLLPYMESVALNDVRAGRASTLTLTLNNADGRFTGAWRGTKGDSIAVEMPPASTERYAIKTISVRQSPRLVVWEAEARPATTKAVAGRGSGSPPPKSGAIVSEKKSWDKYRKNVTLKAVAGEVCSECGLMLKYCAKPNPEFSYVSRYNETGFHLINRLARSYGLDVRATAGELIIMGGVPKTEKSPVKPISVELAQVQSFGTAQEVSASSVQSGRLDPRKAAPVRHSAGDGDGVSDDADYDLDDASAIYDATRASAQSSEVTIIPRAGVVSGCVVQIADFGLREVTQMRYTRTGDAETMTLTTREYAG
jgi:hypothetical protein